MNDNPTTLTDDDRAHAVCKSAELYVVPENKRLTLFVWANADLVNEMSDAHPLKPELQKMLQKVVHHVVTSTLDEIRDYFFPFAREHYPLAAPGSNQVELDAMRDAVRAEEWFRAAGATQRWLNRLRAEGSDEGILTSVSRLRDVFLGLVQSPIDEQSGGRPEWIAYASAPDSTCLIDSAGGYDWKDGDQ